MSEKYDEHTNRHRRISILTYLYQTAAAYRSNDSLLTTIVNDFGIVTTRAQMRGELTWLRDQGYISLREIEGVMVATLTEAGTDIATGHRTDPGIARRSPKG